MKRFPICIFAYNRPDKLIACIDSVLKNPDCKYFDLYLFCDGPMTPNDNYQVAQVQSIAENITGFNAVYVQKSLHNKGLATSVIDGLNLVLELHPGVIVLEDDLTVSHNFLDFMNNALETYENVERVASVHGNFNSFNFPLPPTFLMKFSDCWGWGTWKESWKLMNPNSRYLANLIRDTKRINEFNLFGAYPFFELLMKESTGEIDSWAIRWQASLFVNDRLSLYCKEQLVHNIGLDGSGTHGDRFRLEDRRFNGRLPQLTEISIKPHRTATLIFAFQLVGIRFRSLIGSLLVRLESLVQTSVSDNVSSSAN